jgi:hypothetical protein
MRVCLCVKPVWGTHMRAQMLMCEIQGVLDRLFFLFFFKQMLICDIQGVADYYTDPQIHSIDGFFCFFGHAHPP